jgi:thiamine biosynthesis lipoprotein
MIKRSLQRYEYTQLRMGVGMRIVVYAPGEEPAVRACQETFKRAADLEQIMSDYRPDSELMHLCQRAVRKSVRVSKELFYILQRAQKLASQTSGAFDVTVGPLVQLWRRARQSKQLPSERERMEAMAKVGWHKLELNVCTRTARLEAEGMRLDLGGIAKGYACDEALRVLRRHRLNRALVEMGGDMVMGDAPPGQDGWKIDLPDFGMRNSEFRNGSTLKFLKKVAVSTSGDTEQFVEIDGVRYAHIVDPRTGLGLTTRAMATVIAPNGITSDSLATAACVLGESRAYELRRYYRNIDIRVRQVRENASGAFG